MAIAGDNAPAGRDQPDQADGERAADQRLARVEKRARLNLLWEEAWRRLAPLLALFGVFLSVSWFGLWSYLPTWPRFAILGAMGVAAAYLLLRLIRLPLPDEDAPLRRVESASGTEHRPATAFRDTMATASGAASTTLWQAHRRQLLSRISGLTAGLPRPALAARDPFALRYLVLLVAMVAFVAAGPQRLDRLVAAFAIQEPAEVAAARVDAWVTPPAYTGQPPIFLTGNVARTERPSHTVPAGSLVTVLIGHGSELAVVERTGSGETELAPETVTASSSNEGIAPKEYQLELTGDRTVAVKRGTGDLVGWRFTVINDEPPVIGYLKEPTSTPSALTLTYALGDDYGVVSAEALIAPLPSISGEPARPLYNAPELPLSLPQLRTREGNAETVRDLSTHPWAGARVRISLLARDEIGQEGQSEAHALRLPARAFGNPLARAVAEQRGKLALDANARDRVADALDALTLGGDIARAGDHLALRSAYRRLNLARNDDDLRGVAEYLWAIALGIEEGDLSPALRDLHAAQEALRQALEEGASDEEISRLTEELRQAMRDFLQALMNDAQRNPNLSQMPRDLNSQVMRMDDLERMLDRIEDLARSGARDSAEQLLSQLQNMLDNLQAGRMPQGDQQSGEMAETLNRLGEMIRRQEELLNETFRAERGNNPDGSGEQLTQEQLEEALRNLEQGQQALADALRELMQRMDDLGQNPGEGQGQAADGELGEAGEAMGQAAGELGEGQPGAALGSQGQALDALRRGTQQMMEQMAQGQQPGQGQDGLGVNGPFGQNSGDADPLGRPRQTTAPDLGTTVKVPDEIDAQRAREILDAIRRRLGEIGRPEIERDYLERLLERF